MKGRYLEEYKCGCSQVEKLKRDLLGYCKYHGDDAIRVHVLPTTTECGHSNDPEEED